MNQTVVVLDFGSQYTQLIARRVRENRVFSKVYPFYTPFEKVMEDRPKGIIFSGSPANVYSKNAPVPDKRFFCAGIPGFVTDAASFIKLGRVPKSKSVNTVSIHISKPAILRGDPKTLPAE